MQRIEASIQSLSTLNSFKKKIRHRWRQYHPAAILETKTRSNANRRILSLSLSLSTYWPVLSAPFSPRPGLAPKHRWKSRFLPDDSYEIYSQPRIYLNQRSYLLFCRRAFLDPSSPQNYDAAFKNENKRSAKLSEIGFRDDRRMIIFFLFSPSSDGEKWGTVTGREEFFPRAEK